MLTIKDVRLAMSTNMRTAVTQDLVDKLNLIDNDPHIAREVRDNFMTYSMVLREGKFKTEDYLYAVKYVTCKLMGYTNKDSYLRTFPDRYAQMKSQGKSEKDISSFVANYNKNKLVNLIYEQSIIPSWILNQDAYQEAINTQVDIMRNSQSDIARTNAANSVLTHLSKPKEAANFQLSIGTEDSSGMKELKASLEALAKQQIEMIKQGVGTKEITESSLVIDGEYEDESDQ